MLTYLGLGFFALTILFFVFVATRNGKFRYERSGVINAAPEAIFPYISNLKLGGQWSPSEIKDPNMKKVFSGPADQAGGKMAFEGNRDAGSGSVEILKVVKNQRVDLSLKMIKPFKADNLVEYTLMPVASGGTRLTWTMSGEGGFMGKLVVVMIDWEKVVGDEFVRGIENLKVLIEKPQS
ncbi:MAG: SRPBCC family protein [Bdellovibrio sp.]|jgi:hypothetical protein